MDVEYRRLLSRATKAEEDVQLLRDRLAAAYQEIEYARAKVPAKIHQVSCDAPAVPVTSALAWSNRRAARTQTALPRLSRARAEPQAR